MSYKVFTILRFQVWKNVVDKELGQVHQLIGLCNSMLQAHKGDPHHTPI